MQCWCQEGSKLINLITSLNSKSKFQTMMDPSSSSSTGPTATAGGGITGGGNTDGIPFVSAWIAGASRRYQLLLDKSTPHVLRRWLGFLFIASVYVVRVVVIQGFYIVSYGLGIYVLSLLIAFLSPQVDPEIQELVDGAGPTLPTRSSDEYRPFVRRLPEFKFWHSITKAFCIAFVLTFFSAFDVPVFWPILAFYWFVLFVATMKRQILHMIKYKYVPFSTGKQRYGKKPVPTQDSSLPRAST